MNLLLLQINVSAKDTKLGIDLVNLAQFCVAYLGSPRCHERVSALV